MNLKERYYDFYFYDLAKYAENSLFNKILNKRLNIFEKISCYLDANNIDESILNHFFDEVFFSYENKNFRDLYFIKNQKVYTNKEVKIKNYIIKFDLKYFDVCLNNNRDILSFDLENIENNIITINVYSYNKGTLLKSKNEIDENILLFLKEKNIELEEKDIIKAIKSFKRVKTKPIMLYKNPKETFKKSLDSWIFNNFYKDGSIDNIINKSYNHFLNIIDLVADVENELTAMWLKPKFTKNTHYVFSLDTIKSYSNNADEILKSIYKDNKFKEQITEWEELKFINDRFDIKDINDEKYKFLPLDTKYLSGENYYKLLQSFENLDEILNGELVKADNFQALNFLMSKYQDKIDLIYIDPPFNTENNQFAYLDKFKDSTWLSMMSNRLEIAKNLLSSQGSIYVHLDYNGDYLARILLDDVFGKENFRNEVIWAYDKWTSSSDNFQRNHDTILFYKKENAVFNEIREITENLKEKYSKGYLLGGGYGSDGLVVYDKNNEKVKKMIDSGKYKVVYAEPNGKPVSDVWRIPFINPVASERIKNEENLTQKPEALLQRIINASSNGKTERGNDLPLESDLQGGSSRINATPSLVLDFFAGSGTTLATAHKMGRKWLGVEMGEHFDTVILPRMKKVLSGEQGGISKATNFSGGGCFKYYELESYDENLEIDFKNQCLNDQIVIRNTHYTLFSM